MISASPYPARPPAGPKPTGCTRPAPGITPRPRPSPPGGGGAISVTSPDTLNHLENSKTYHPLITAVNRTGEHPPSPKITATLQAAPSALPSRLADGDEQPVPCVKLDATAPPLAEQRATFERQPSASIKKRQQRAKLGSKANRTRPALPLQYLHLAPDRLECPHRPRQCA